MKRSTDTDKNPLVSIIVITYNSAKYVIETLESAKAQTYQNIELIISDDCSTDTTVAVCKDWLLGNEDRFIRTKLITTPVNTGIPKNCNRGLYASKGEWVKLIAGDDALMLDCIKDNIEFVHSNSDINFCFSDYESYLNIFDSKNLIENNSHYLENSIKFSRLKSEFQLKVLARGQLINAPSTFLNRNEIIKIGGYSEEYRNMEDWPTYFNILKSEHKFYFLPTKTVKYRLHSNSISNKKDSEKYEFSNFYLKVEEIFKNEFLRYYTVKEKILFKLEYAYYKYYFNNKNLNFVDKIIRRCWYYFVEQSLKERKKALKVYYKKMY